MKKIIDIFRYLLGLPKTLYFNFKYFPIKIAIKIPVVVSHKVKFRSLSGTVELRKIKCGIVRIGFGTIDSYEFGYTPTIFSNKGKIIFDGKCKIGYGTAINNEGIIRFGENVNTSKIQVICREKIEIGKNSIIGWDCLIMDTDHHHIYDTNEIKINENKEIKIGEHVWLGAKTTILKGVTIGKNNVIAIGTTVAKSILENNMIIGNTLEMKKIKNFINWKE